MERPPEILPSNRGEETRTLNIVLIEETKLLDEVVVSAGKHEQKLSEVTVSVDIIKSKTLENTNTTSIEKALNQVSRSDYLSRSGKYQRREVAIRMVPEAVYYCY